MRAAPPRGPGSVPSSTVGSNAVVTAANIAISPRRESSISVVARSFRATLCHELGTPAELGFERMTFAQRDACDQVAEDRNELERVARAAGRDDDVRTRRMARD